MDQVPLEPQLHETRPVAFVVPTVENQRQAEGTRDEEAAVGVAINSMENVFLDHGRINKSYEDELKTLKNRQKFYEVHIPLVNHSGIHCWRNDRIQKLHAAAQQNDIESINYFIEADYELDGEDSFGATPLLTAVMHENYDVARLLRRAHIDVLLERLLGQNPPPPSFYHAHKREIKIEQTNLLVQKMIEKKVDAVRIGKILAEIDCNLDEVTQFRDPIMTKAFLLSCTNENADVKIVVDMFDFDVQHIQVLINYGLKSLDRKREFVYLLLANICDYQKSKAGRNFLTKLSCREIIDEDFLENLEELLRKFPKMYIKVILKYGFNLIAIEKYDRDITANLFANRRPKVISLLNGKIDVDRRYHGGNTPLHIAAKYYAADNIQLLLDKGADPNAINDQGDTPLSLALKSNGFGHPGSEESIELLLLAGANPILIADQFEDTFFSFNPSTYISNYATYVSKLLVAQLAIYEAADLSAERSIKKFMAFGDPELKKYFEKCRQELVPLKTQEIRDTSNNQNQDSCKMTVNLLTILAEKPENIVRCISEEQLQVITELAMMYRKKSLNVYYRQLLRERIKNIIDLNCYKKRAIQFVCQFTDIHDANHLVVHKIISYFAVKDLVIFNDENKRK